MGVKMTLRDQTPAEIDAAVAAAHAASNAWATSDAVARAALLRGLADALEGARERLVPLADRETSLGPARLNGELDRTAFQLRGFATRVEAGDAFAWIDDPAVAGAPPVGHPHLARLRVPLGPVAMFAASNFPFAFSVLGGDTASALAAGCPVVVKAHPGHPELSRAAAALARDAVAAQGVPTGVFGMVEGAGVEVGVHLVQHPDIAAVAFTGSFKGGAALQQVANARARPIPFFGELGSINPVVALPSALGARGAELAAMLAGSISLGCGQFCTSPGIVLLLEHPASDAFVDALAQALGAQQPHAMLTPGMRRNFDAGVGRLAATKGVRALLSAEGGAGPAPRPFLGQIDAPAFAANPALHEEVFGPAALIVRAASVDEAVAALHAIGGSLTVTLWGAEDESADTRRLVRAAVHIAGRVLFSGVPTGVAVTAAQQHGGPWPSSTRPESTSVGWAALDRFLRPVALQDAPAWVLARQGWPC
jgi:acyl-CoA reductase-like NAD-dependent aldehyde dehydrogenase